MRLFGKAKVKKETQAPTPVSSVEQLRDTLQTLEKRQLHLSKRILMQQKEAQDKAKARDKKGALFALKRKKLYESEVNKLDGARMTIETQILALENAHTSVMALNAMKMGTAAMRQAHTQWSIEEVDNIVEELQEGQQLQEEITQALSQPTGVVMDDDELLEELNQLEALDIKDVEEKLPSVPVAPKKVPASYQAEEDEEVKQLRQLEASMMA
eukprot:GILK01007628.1.p1 GENE.GILK01007628.1~~GILK01007628.1.p1  ORF type:complete len:213 (+),score=59.90 GILK01007628.1:246-884(+)